MPRFMLRRDSIWFVTWACLIWASCCLYAFAVEVELTVDTRRVVREGADHFIGIDLNYIRDSDLNRMPMVRPLGQALHELNVFWLRYPGGEKSDYYRWAQPPDYVKPEPKSLPPYDEYPGQRMDFDSYMKIVAEVKGEPYVVVAYDTFERTGTRKEELIKSAAAWVRYANLVKKYHVRYWEIGNENWYNDTAKPEEMAYIVKEFSLAMKAVDPTIQVGSNGSDSKWWRKFLPAAAPYLDFISLSLYNCYGWGSYDHFPQHLNDDTISQVHEALMCVDEYAPLADRSRIKVLIPETNSKDYAKAKAWLGRNNLGHALVVFDTFGRVMETPRVLGAMFWTTRWMDDEDAEKSQFYSLDKENRVLPVGMGIGLWGRFIQSTMIAVEGSQDTIRAYACKSEDGGMLSIWILNPSAAQAIPVSILVRSTLEYKTIKSHVFTGLGPNDEHPALKEIPPPVYQKQSILALKCLPVSVTILTLE